MRSARLFLLLALLTAPGCFLNPFQIGNKDGSRGLAKVPPAPVTADQINPKNAHQQAGFMFDELDYEEVHAKDAKPANR